MKVVLQRDELVEFIKENKKIVFNTLFEEKDIKVLLNTYNYLNVFSLKYFFANGKRKVINEDRTYRIIYVYDYNTRYKILKKKYLELLKFENKIREGVLKYELELKSHFIFFLEEFLRANNLQFKDFLTSLEDYDFNTKTIKSISQKTLDKIEKEWKKQTDIFPRKNPDFSIGNIFSDLQSIIVLRNSLCHKESLIIFLEKGLKANNIYKNPKKDFLQIRINAVSRIYEYYYLRNNKKKSLKENTWIKNYTKYRLGNRKVEKFEKLKINV